MNNFFAVIFISGLASIGFSNPIVNGSFDEGLAGFSPIIGPAGTVFVTQSWDGFTATDGSNFVVLQASSELSQTITASANDKLTFDWNFDAKDYLPYDDYSILTISGTGKDFSATIDVSDVGNFGKSGWQTYTYTFQNDFSGTMKFGSYNAIDDGLSSFLDIDNIKMHSAAVPEPGMFSLLGFGLFSFAGLAFLRKWKKQ